MLRRRRIRLRNNVLFVVAAIVLALVVVILNALGIAQVTGSDVLLWTLGAFLVMVVFGMFSRMPR